MAHQGPAANGLGWTKQNHRGDGSSSALEDSPNRDQSSDSWQAKSTNMQKHVIAFAKQAQDLATMIEKFIEDITTHIEELEHDTRQNRTNKEVSRETEKKLKELEEKYVDEIYKMRQKLTEVEKENAKLKEEVKISRDHRKDEMKTKELEGKLDRREKQLQKLRDECDDLKNRLSKIISQRINDGNPDVTDLSNENRATKLAERYSELYDNQWTDAFEEIQSHLAPHQDNNETVEKKAISILLQALKEAMQFCECEIKEQDIHIKEALLRGSKIKMELPEAFMYQLKQTKKFLADKTVNVVCQNFLAHKPSIMDFPTDKIKTFVTECVIISWLMVNHDPPIALDVTAKTGDSFDSKKYKEYTKRGPKIDFLVWPPMQIKGHSLLIRGVVQCKHEYVEDTERYPKDKTVASRLKVQTDASNYTADDRIHTPDDRTKVMTYKSEIKQAWNVAHGDTGDIQEYRRGYNKQDYNSDRLTSRIRPNDYIGSPVDRNDALTKAGRKKEVFDNTRGTYTNTTSAQPVKDRSTFTDLSEIRHSNNHFLHTNAYKNSRGGQYYADSTGEETFMRTLNYDLSSKGRDHAADTGVTLDQRYDETSRGMREYKDQNRYSSPSKADEYGYEGRTYIEVNDIVSQTIVNKHWQNKAAYKQRVVSPTRQHPHKHHEVSPTYHVYDKPNEADWFRYMEYKNKNCSREFIEATLGKPSFNRCEIYYCYKISNRI